uniref:Uncharacterized protein n=1 Tax=Knipowitschia caucasica TaxID=637954 RepID=A0AAV2JE11_KNICA
MPRNGTKENIPLTHGMEEDSCHPDYFEPWHMSTRPSLPGVSSLLDLGQFCVMFEKREGKGHREDRLRVHAVFWG